MKHPGFEIWPGPMEGVGNERFVKTVNALALTRIWMTPFLRLSNAMPRTGKLKTFLAPYKSSSLPVTVQLMGCDPVLIGETAAKLIQLGADGINLNFGCPSARVVSGGAGGGALKHPEKLSAFCAAVKKQMPADAELSVKTRSGWDSPQEMETILNSLLDSQSVSKIFLHYRTVSELYSPAPLPERAKRLTAAVSLCRNIPLIANGDISTPREAEQLVAAAGCAGVMIARPWMRDPYLLRRFYGDDTPVECGREKFFEEAKKQNISGGQLIELARMLWGVDSARFRSL